MESNPSNWHIPDEDGFPASLSPSDLSENLLKLQQANNKCKHPAQMNTDPYSQPPGTGQEHPSQLSQLSSTGGEFPANRCWFFSPRFMIPPDILVPDILIPEFYVPY